MIKFALRPIHAGLLLIAGSAASLAFQLYSSPTFPRQPGDLPRMMSPAAACSFVVLAVVLILVEKRKMRAARWLATISAGAATLVFLDRLSGGSIGFHLAAERAAAFINSPFQADRSLTSLSAAGFLLAFIAMALLAWRDRVWAADALVGALATVIGAIGFAAFVGFLVGDPLLLGADTVTISASSACAFVLLAAACLIQLATVTSSRHDSATAPLEKRYALGAGAALGVSLLMALLAYDSTLKSVQAGRWIEQKQELLVALEALFSAMKDAETGERGYLLTGEDRLLEPYYDAIGQVGGHLEAVSQHISDHPRRIEMVTRLIPQITNELLQLERGINLRRAGHTAEAVRLAASVGQRMMDQIRDDVAALQTDVRDDLRARIREREETRRRTLFVYAAAMMAIAAILLAVHWTLERDLSGRRRAVAILRRHNNALREFTHSVAHDLRIPVQGINSFARELSRHHASGLDHRGLHCVQQIGASAGLLDRLIEDSIDYARLEAERLKLAPVELPLLAATLIRERAPRIRELNIRISSHFDVTRIASWEQGLAQALGHLLDNAIKFTRPSPDPAISITSRETAETWIIAVTDNGIGFDPADVPRLFRLFARLENAAGFEGTGAGLAHVRKIVTRLGGTATATAAAGRGAVFTIELPKTTAGAIL